MKLELPVAQDFGTHLADGSKALEYRVARIDPYITVVNEIIIDFTGVRHANSSFVNALVSGIVEQHGQHALSILAFKGCNPVIRLLVESAIDLGLQNREEKVAA